jgi:transcriptional antiterminator RfaH
MTWIVAMTKPNSEAIAGYNLQRQGFEYYLPQIQIKHPNKKTQIRPLFPRYIFIAIKDAWYCLKSTRGIARILLGDDGPQVLPSHVIDTLKKQEDSKGYVALEPKPKFLPGDKLKATEGPFLGLPLLYDGMSAHDRVYVLLEFMGRKTRTEVDAKILVAA